MNRRFSKVILSALAIAAVGGLTVLHTGLTALAATWYVGDSEIVTRTYPISDSFSNISVTNYYADVDFRVSQDGAIRVVTQDFSDVTYTVAVNNNTLTIARPDRSVTKISFFEIHIHSDNEGPQITVYLPAGSYGDLTVSGTTGDIETSSQLGFASAKIDTTSGDISLNGPVTGSVECSTSSGDIELNSPTLGNVRTSSSSGDVDLTGCYIQSLRAEASSGDIDLERVTAAGEVVIGTSSGDISLEGTEAGSLRLSASSGDIKLERSDAGTLELNTTSGNIEGSLLTGKEFSTSSNSGRVRVTTSGPSAGTCTANTSSGNIRLTVLS